MAYSHFMGKKKKKPSLFSLQALILSSLIPGLFYYLCVHDSSNIRAQLQHHLLREVKREISSLLLYYMCHSFQVFLFLLGFVFLSQQNIIFISLGPCSRDWYTAGTNKYLFREWNVSSQWVWIIRLLIGSWDGGNTKRWDILKLFTYMF